ncbi:MAG: glycosyltransferase family A protein [Pirellulaceae bacterium]
MTERDTDPRYTIAICNYEMVETLAESLESIVSQVDDRFEVLVVDDGSRDGSLTILEEFAEHYDKFRFVEGDNNNLAEARNCSFRQAEGEYVIESLDVDDRYEPIIQDFVTIYHKIESALDREFYLWGHGINMAPRDLLLEVPYRSLGYGEDKDFWRRLAARGQIVFRDHSLPCTSIGYDRTTTERLSIWLEMTTVEFQTGITLGSFVTFNLRQALTGEYKPRAEAAFELFTAPIAYWRSRKLPRYDSVPGYQRYGALEREIRRQTTGFWHVSTKLIYRERHAPVIEALNPPRGAGAASDFPSMTMATGPAAVPDPRGQVQQGFQGLASSAQQRDLQAPSIFSSPQPNRVLGILSVVAPRIHYIVINARRMPGYATRSGLESVFAVSRSGYPAFWSCTGESLLGKTGETRYFPSDR